MNDAIWLSQSHSLAFLAAWGRPKGDGRLSGASACRSSTITYWAYVAVHESWGTIPLLLGLIVIVLTFAMRRKNADVPGDAVRAWAACVGGLFFVLYGVAFLGSRTEGTLEQT